MMNSSLLRFTRFAAVTAAKRTAVAPTALRAVSLLHSTAVTLSSGKKQENGSDSDDETSSFGRVPPEDYYQGHLMADHLEFLEDMIDKTAKLEESVESLKQTHQQFVQNVKWMDGQDIEELLEPTRKKKEDITKQLVELRKLMASAKKTYAVDAPDGESDGHIQEELLEIKHIIDDAAVLEDKDAILRQRKLAAENKKTFAVDAPDGTSTGQIKEQMAEVRHIIDDAAVLEDKKKIEYKHKMDSAVRKERARDPEHDW
jgi:hypothetical protein